MITLFPQLKESIFMSHLKLSDINTLPAGRVRGEIEGFFVSNSNNDMNSLIYIYIYKHIYIHCNIIDNC